jgi:hypothetical protein
VGRAPAPLGALRSVQPWRPAYSRVIGFLAGAANQPRRTCGRSIRWRGSSVHWVCCEGLPRSCHETVTCVKPPHRTRSQSRISSLAAIARRIADDRALKAPGSALVFGCASTGDARPLPAAEIHDEGEHDDDRSDQGYDERFVSPFRAGEAGDRQRRPTRKLMNTEAAKYRTCCWSRAPVDVVTMIRKAGPRDARRRRSGPFYFLACSK